MSGTLQVAGDSVWMPQSRVFDAVVTEIATELSYDDLAADVRIARHPGSATSELAAMLLAGRTVDGTGHIDLTDAQPSAIERIRRATRDVVLREVAAGDSGRFGADWFLRSVDAASLLGAMLGHDPRLGDDGPASVMLRTGSYEATWHAPAWAVAFGLEHLAARLRTDLPSVSVELLDSHLAARDRGGAVELDVNRLAAVVDAAREIRERHPVGAAYDAYAPGLFVVLAAALDDLTRILDQSTTWAERKSPGSP